MVVVVRLVYLSVLMLCWGVYLRWGNGGIEGQMLGIISSGSTVCIIHILQLLFAEIYTEWEAHWDSPSPKPKVPPPPPSHLEHNPSHSSCSNAI